MNALPGDLRTALDATLETFAPQELIRSVRRLVSRYRDGSDLTEPILGSDLDVAAYAAYRMPATFAAVRSSMQFFAEVMPAFSPRTHVDIGGGTGAAAWAAADTWQSVNKIVVLEQLPRVIAFGRLLAQSACSAVVREASWHQATATATAQLKGADLVTMSYLLGELPATARNELVTQWAAVADALIIVEPGTPKGYERVVAARDLLIGLGLTIAAPCPHEFPCPIPRGRDWCHFSARINRSPLHRLVKAGTLSFEDEKFSYVAATPRGALRAANRVIRHPQKRKGIVSLRLCSGSGELTTAIVPKRQGESYRAARDVTWGGAWPPLSDNERSR